MWDNFKRILLLQSAFAISEKIENCQIDKRWSAGVFELCSKDNGLCSRCPLNFQRCFKKEKNEDDQDMCFVCMKWDQSNHMNYFGIHGCSGLSRESSNRIVISIDKMSSCIEDDDWKELQAIPKVSNIMFGDTHVLFRAENSLGFSCEKAFRRCGGDPEGEQSNSKLKELGNCMQCSCPPSKCSYQDIESNSGLVGAWDNKGIKKCQSGRGNVCSCETGFKVCDIQTDEREVGSKCRACVKATYKETLKKAECLDKKIINRPKSANTESEETENNEATENWNPLIIGGSVAGIVILVLVIVLLLVLTRRRKRASSANQRDEKDENPIYGPRDTIYLDEVDFFLSDLYLSCDIYLQRSITSIEKIRSIVTRSW